MRNRLQVGGLALILDSVDEEIIGEVVVIAGHDGFAVSPHDGNLYNYWNFDFDDELCSLPDFCLMPLGDDKGVELYGLREEIMTGHDKEAV